MSNKDSAHGTGPKSRSEGWKTAAKMLQDAAPISVPEGAVRFELEGEPERVVEAGGTFWEPGGDAIHYQDGNALSDARTRFVVTMMCAPGKPMLELVDEEELARRAHLRAPRPAA